jgi:hypothetical protein
MRPGAASVRPESFAAALAVTGQQPVPVLQHVAPRRQQYPLGPSAFGGQQTGKPTWQQPGCPASFTSGRQQLGKSLGQQEPKGSSEFGVQQTLLSSQNPPNEQQRLVRVPQSPRLLPCSLQHFPLQHCFRFEQSDSGARQAAAASCRPRRPSAVHSAPLASTLSARRGCRLHRPGQDLGQSIKASTVHRSLLLAVMVTRGHTRTPAHRRNQRRTG